VCSSHTINDQHGATLSQPPEGKLTRILVILPICQHAYQPLDVTKNVSNFLHSHRISVHDKYHFMIFGDCIGDRRHFL
jgi:hypothetical protein